MEDKTIYLLYEGDEWLSKDSLVLMGVFSSMETLLPATKSLIWEHVDENFDPRDYDYDITKDEWVEEQIVEFAEYGQTSEGSTLFISKTAELDKVEEI